MKQCICCKSAIKWYHFLRNDNAGYTIGTLCPTCRSIATRLIEKFENNLDIKIHESKIEFRKSLLGEIDKEKYQESEKCQAT